MPQLEELSLSLVTFRPYSVVELTLRDFSLWKYSYHNIVMGMRNAPKIHDTISGRSLPLIVSAKTSNISRSRSAAQTSSRRRSRARISCVSRRTHAQHELQEYARLVARCARLARVVVANIGDADLAHSAHLFVAAALRRAHTRTWMHLLHDLADAAVARVLQHAPAMRGLRVCALSLPPAEHLSVGAMLLLTRGVCAAGRIELRLTVF